MPYKFNPFTGLLDTAPTTVAAINEEVEVQKVNNKVAFFNIYMTQLIAGGL